MISRNWTQTDSRMTTGETWNKKIQINLLITELEASLGTLIPDGSSSCWTYLTDMVQHPQLENKSKGASFPLSTDSVSMVQTTHFTIHNSVPTEVSKWLSSISCETRSTTCWIITTARIRLLVENTIRKKKGTLLIGISLSVRNIFWCIGCQYVAIFRCIGRYPPLLFKKLTRKPGRQVRKGTWM